MQSIYRVAVREVRSLARRPLMWFCMVLAPLFCYVFFTSLMASGLPTNLPLGLVDCDRTTTTRQLARNLDAFQQTDIVREYANVSDARRDMQRGLIYGFYYIPEGTTREAQRQTVPTVSFYTNYSFLIAGSLLYRDMRTMTELVSGAATQTVLYARGATEGQAMAFLQPVVVDSHPVGNPWLNYSVYLSNTLVPGMLMLFVFMVTVYTISMEIKEETARGWLLAARGSMWKALAGKLLPQTLVFWLVGSLYVVYLYGFLHFPCRCGMATMLLVMALFVVASQGMGVIMITTLPTPRLGLSFASLWGVISFSICGMSFPVMAMHPVLQGVSYLFPLRHYFLLYVNCALDGYPLMNAWPFVAGLLAFAIVPVLLLPKLKHALLYCHYEP